MSPKVTATSLGVTSTATETLSSPSSSSLQNMAGEETTLGFDDPNALSVSILMTLGNSSVQTLRHSLKSSSTNLQRQETPGAGGKEHKMISRSGRTQKQSLCTDCSIKGVSIPPLGHLSLLQHSLLSSSVSEEGAAASSLHLPGEEFQATHTLGYKMSQLILPVVW